MGVSENGGTPKSSILIGISIIKHPFWGPPIFGNIQMMVGRWVSFWDCLFLEATSNFQGVYCLGLYHPAVL